MESPKLEEALPNLTIIDSYILTPDIFDLLSDTEPGKGGRTQITDALMKKTRIGCVFAYNF